MADATARPRIGRRAVLTTGGLAAGLALLRPSQAAATTGSLQYGAANDAGSDPTSLTCSTGGSTLTLSQTGGTGSALQCTSGPSSSASTVFVEQNGPGTGIWVDAVGRALNLRSFSGSAPAAEIEQQGLTGAALAVTGSNTINPDPLVTISALGLGPHLLVDNTVTTNTAAVVDVRQAGTGRALNVLATNTSSGAQLVYLQSNGTGRVLTAYLNSSGSTQAAAKMQTNGTGAAVEAVSKNGRGVYAAGKLAQLRLQPAAASTHPTTGAAGDLFVDAAKRLWFCKGGTRWVQVA